MSNTISQHAQPNVTSTGFNRKWCGNSNLLTVMSDVLNNQTFLTNLDYLLQNPSDFFVSMRVYPFDVRRYFNYHELSVIPTSRIKMGFSEIQYDGQYVQGVSFPGGVYYKHIGTFTVDRKFNNYMDYSPYTKLELYIPFCGIVNLDVNVVMGKEIRLFYSVDWDTGAVTTYIIKHEDESDDLIMTANGQIGFEFPLGSSNANENAKQMLANALSLTAGVVTSVATSNPLPLILSGISSVNSTINALQERVSKGGMPAGSNAMVSPTKAYLIRTVAKPTCAQSDYASYRGLPLDQKKTLSELTGFTVTNDFHMENFPDATETEKAQIETALKNGIIL